MIDKKRNYGEMVKEMHWPTISKKKKLELEMLKSSLKHPIRSHYKHPSTVGGPKSKKFSVGDGATSDNEDGHTETLRRRKIMWDKENPMVPKPKPAKVAQSIDWLKEMRNKRQIDEKEGKNTSPQRNPLDW